MTRVSFKAMVGPDRMIRVPDEVSCVEGEAEVVLYMVNGAPAVEQGVEEPMAATKSYLLAAIDEFSRIADETGHELPNDMSVNHTWYALHPPE